jgi:arsenate reductase-like glutaredoxin family protein
MLTSHEFPYIYGIRNCTRNQKLVSFLSSEKSPESRIVFLLDPFQKRSERASWEA